MSDGARMIEDVLACGPDVACLGAEPRRAVPCIARPAFRAEMRRTCEIRGAR